MGMKMTIVLLTLVLSGCGGGDAVVGGETGADYFPVVAGATWTYEATTWSEPGSWSTTITVPGMTDVGGTQVWVFKESSRMKYGGAYESYFAKVDGAVTFIGEAPTFDFMMDVVPWEFLRSDGALGSAPLLELKQIRALIPNFVDEQVINLKIVGTSGADETITTPAGTFATKRFEYTLVATVPDNWGGTYENRHLLTEWRARGVGLVRQTYMTGARFFSTNWDKRLVSYSIPSAMP
jgi:hypothetical protein